MAMFRISDSKRFLGTTVFYVHIQCYLDLTERTYFLPVGIGNTMSTVAAVQNITVALWWL